MERMKERKIILCTTFREFDESVNSQIQILFLESILNQSYDNYQLVITTFGETTVKSKLEQMFGEKVCVIDENLQDYRYSLSSVVLNGLSVAQQYEESILMWSTCDIILEKDCFKKVNESYTEDMVITVHPNYVAKTIDSFCSRSLEVQDIDNGFDIFFFATELLRKKEVINILKEYYFYEWGVFEHFLVGIGIMYSKHMLNFINYSDVIKIENDRIASKEPSAFLKTCRERNIKILEKCISETQMTKKVRFLAYCHMQFKVIKWTPTYLFYVTKQTIIVFARMCKVILQRIFTCINH